MVLSSKAQALPGAAVVYDPPPLANGLKSLGDKYGERILEIAALSKPLFDPENVWGKNHRFSGFWHMDTDRTQPAPELEAFLSRWPAPVVLTLGSMVIDDIDRLVQHFGEALRVSGHGGIIVGGWSHLPVVGEHSDRLLGVCEAPYHWLFPRSSCIIHHGGCGTLAAVLRAGKPSILLPQQLCQHKTAQILVRENLAARAMALEEITPLLLAECIERAITDEQISACARRWQQVVCAEPGVRAAANWIEEHHAAISGEGLP